MGNSRSRFIRVAEERRACHLILSDGGTLDAAAATDGGTLGHDGERGVETTVD